MTLEEEQIKLAADEFARAHKREIAERLTDVRKYPPDKEPISVFMAGSPGAGKTEASLNLLMIKGGEGIIRIDPDEIRNEFESYTGSNSSLFQGATSIIANKMQDLVIENGQSYIFDGTLTNLETARLNIRRSIDHGRPTYIIYVYQDPRQAWVFVKAREKRDGRVIPKNVFIDKYFQARENVNILKREFGKSVTIYVVRKNIDGTDINYWQNIDVIDNYIPERYNAPDLEQLIVD